jgi:hypothetical protein
MNILVLIISSDNLPIYKLNKEVWRSYMNKYSNIDCYFMEYLQFQIENNEPFIDNNTLYLNGEESYSNLIDKTLNSLEFFIQKSKKKYDFIVRTNLSSVWDFKLLEEYLNSLPTKQNIYSGAFGPFYNIETHHFWFNFIGGMGIIMSIDICELLLQPENRTITENFKIVDDIDIGYCMHVCNIPILPLQLYEINSMEQFNNSISHIKEKKYVFYRAKSGSGNRQDEPEYMQLIVNILYE